MIVKQIPVGGMDNLCYILIEDNKALIIDPGWEPERILDEVKHLDVIGIVLTHSHFDHTGAVEKIKEKTGAEIIAHDLNPYAERRVKEGDEIRLGKTEIRVIHTPGHTRDSICLLAGRYLFTGDTLFVQGYGRTDFGGNEEDMKRSLSKLMKLPSDTIIYPGHDYCGKSTTINHIKHKDS